MSEVHFRRLFKQLYHTSPHKYIQGLRIEKAKQLLTENRHSIGTISKECGFTNAYYFSRVFRAECGVTPTHYRASAKLLT